jgi:hypothetical protein
LCRRIGGRLRRAVGAGVCVGGRLTWGSRRSALVLASVGSFAWRSVQGLASARRWVDSKGRALVQVLASADGYKRRLVLAMLGVGFRRR